jgi:AP-3 complex subunit beta
MLAGDSQFFQVQNTKLEVIRKQLDSDNNKEKLNAMKKLVAMISKGKDVEEMFPYVVKNVVCKPLELKKLVYMYLIHYAEKQQDEALLAINNFQKGLGDKNQFIRALALRVMSSIRVNLITQIIVMAIKKCAGDVSPYVRKAACLAIPKAYALDNELRDELQEIIEKLLGDNNTMVLGSAVFAFNEVCPNNWELIHPHYRKLCKFLVDCDEWGQVVIMGMLLRYGRTQFMSPFVGEGYQKQNFYSDEEDEDPLERRANDDTVEFDLDTDHRLLLRSCQPLLRARNAAVVLAVAALYFHLAPPLECGKVVLPLLRLVRATREIQYVALCNIATMAKERPELFTSYTKDFYVYSTDALFIKQVKLEILSLLATESTVHPILKELKTYMRFPERAFVGAAIQAVGRVATEIPEVIETCIHALMQLISHKDESVVAESVIVIRHLLQQNPAEHKRVIGQMAILLEQIKVPVARASIVWMIGEYYNLIPEVGADALRILARDFGEEHDLVKLQALTLGTKLYLNEGESINLLFQYVLNLARYDQSYDIRDRARFIRSVLFDTRGKCPQLTEKAMDLFTAKKPPAQMNSQFHERSRFQISSMSHMVNHTAFGYEPLPDFPEKKPDASVRNTAEGIGSYEADIGMGNIETDIGKFYESGEDDDEEDEGWENEAEFTSEEDEEDEEGDFYDDDEEEEEEEQATKVKTNGGFYDDEEEGDEEEEESGEYEEESEEESEEEEAFQTSAKKTTTVKKNNDLANFF